MKSLAELKYLAVFLFSLMATVISLILSINKLQPFLFQQIFTSCTAVYETITTNSLIISSLFVVGLLGLVVSLSVKLVLSSYKTSLSFSEITEQARQNIPRKVIKICKKIRLAKDSIIVTNHKKPLAVTAGLVSPKIVISTALIKLLSDQELEAVLLHEMYHQEKKHGLWYVVSEAISSALFVLLPVLREVVSNMKLDFEKHADSYAIQYQGSPTYVFSALRKLSIHHQYATLPSFANMVSLDKHQLRVEKKKLSLSKVIVSVGALMALSFFAFIPGNQPEIVVQAEEIGQSNVCVSKVSAGMTKLQNSSSILPASVF